MAHCILLVTIVLDVSDYIMYFIQVEVGKVADVTLIGELRRVGGWIAGRKSLVLLRRLTGRVLLLILLLGLLNRLVCQILRTLAIVVGEGRGGLLDK